MFTNNYIFYFWGDFLNVTYFGGGSLNMYFHNIIL
jgi:hypothetical protein